MYDVATAKRLPIPQHYLPVGKHLVAGLGGTFNSPRDGVYAAGHHLFTDRDGTAGGEVPMQLGRRPRLVEFDARLHARPDRARASASCTSPASSTRRATSATVVAIQGNYGQSFLWSEDGLFVTPLFKDSRQNPKGWGAKEEFGADWTDVSMYGRVLRRHGVPAGRRQGPIPVRPQRLPRRAGRGTGGGEAIRRRHGGAEGADGYRQSRPRRPTPPDRVLRVPNVTGRFPAFKADGDPAEWKDIPRREIKVGDEVVARVAVAHTRAHLWLLAEVEDPSPWKNAGADPKLAFKTGDAIDICLGTDREPRARPSDAHPEG